MMNSVKIIFMVGVALASNACAGFFRSVGLDPPSGPGNIINGSRPPIGVHGNVLVPSPARHNDGVAAQQTGQTGMSGGGGLSFLRILRFDVNAVPMFGRTFVSYDVGLDIPIPIQLLLMDNLLGGGNGGGSTLWWPYFGVGYGHLDGSGIVWRVGFEVIPESNNLFFVRAETSFGFGSDRYRVSPMLTVSIGVLNVFGID